MRNRFRIRHGAPTVNFLNQVTPAGPISIFAAGADQGTPSATRPHASAAGIEYRGLHGVGYYPAKVVALKPAKETPEHERFVLQLTRHDGKRYVQRHGTLHRAA